MPGQPVADGKGPLPVLPPAPTVAADSGKVLLSAAAGAFGDTSGRVFVSVNVTARNVATLPISLDQLCLLQVRAFGGAAAQGPIAWTAPEIQPNVCPPLSGIRIVLAAGQVTLGS